MNKTEEEAGFKGKIWSLVWTCILNIQVEMMSKQLDCMGLEFRGEVQARDKNLGFISM